MWTNNFSGWTFGGTKKSDREVYDYVLKFNFCQSSTGRNQKPSHTHSRTFCIDVDNTITGMFFVIYSRWTLCSWAVVNGSPTQSIKQTFPVQGNILIGHFFTFTKILQSDLFGRHSTFQNVCKLGLSCLYPPLQHLNYMPEGGCLCWEVMIPW